MGRQGRRRAAITVALSLSFASFCRAEAEMATSSMRDQRGPVSVSSIDLDVTSSPTGGAGHPSTRPGFVRTGEIRADPGYLAGPPRYLTRHPIFCDFGGGDIQDGGTWS